MVCARALSFLDGKICGVWEQSIIIITVITVDSLCKSKLKNLTSEVKKKKILMGYSGKID